MYEKFRLYKNYALISVVSIVCLLFFPFVSSEVGMGIVLPDTFAGWMVYVVSKMTVAAVNMLLLYCFVDQGKFNIREDKRYLDALALLGKISPENRAKPISPAQHYRRVFGMKGTTLFITSLVGSFALTQAILAFDVITFITYLITLLTGIVFGIIQMGAEEVFWTESFPYYVRCLVEEEEEKNRANKIQTTAMEIVAENP